MVAGAGIATILFTDLVGSTALTDRLGDDLADELRKLHFTLIRQAVTTWRGEEVKTLGDGHMVVFASTLDAIGCAIAVQQAVELHNAEPGSEPLQVRIGINAGEVMHEEDDYFGTPVVVAKRLCDQAVGGQIIVSDLVSSLVGSRGQFSFRQLGPLQLRGLSQPLPAREVVWREPHEEPPTSRGRPRWLVPALAGVLVAAAVVSFLALRPGPSHAREPAAQGIGKAILDTTGLVRGPDSPAHNDFIGNPGDVVTIDVTRAETNLDLYVEVLDRDGVVEAFDDDSGPGFEPQVSSLRLTKAGRHQVLVYVVAPSTSGGYRLRVRAADPRPEGQGPWYGDLRAPSEEGRFPVQLQAGRTVDVAVTVDGHHHFDAVVELYGPDGRLATFDDDSGTYHDPEIKAERINSTGVWTVVVRGATARELGAYRVRVA